MDDTLNRIILLFDKSGMKKIEFLTKLGLSRSAWGAWVRGDTTSYLKMLPQIATIFGVSVDWLSGNEQKNKATTRHSDLISEALSIMNGLPKDRQDNAIALLRAMAALSDKTENK